MHFNKNIKIKVSDKNIIVYLKNKIFLKQDYIINKDYTFFLIVLILGKYGLLNHNN